MKKLFALFAMLLITLTAVAQEYKEIKSTEFVSTYNGSSTDTVANTGVRIVRIPVNRGFWNSVGIAANVTKISGTVAGVIRLVGSYDGSNWFRVNPTDSLIATNVTTNYKSFTLSSYHFNYLGLQYTGAGTMAAKLNGYAILKRQK